MDLGYEEVVALPVSSDSRQSVNVELPTAILRNLQTYLEYVHETKCTLLYAKRHSAQPDMFWRTHHTKPDPKSMRVMPLCLWGV
jgi:hypothetical protein